MESAVASSSPPSTSTSALPAGEYEVFLSFRGPDVRITFADHLYTSLARAKIRTFRDEEELQKGKGIAPSLIRAISESKIYIPILTKHYASSKWCLQELTQMVECWKQKKGHLILPIFYFVDPGDVRHQQGPYQQEFEHHAKERSPKTIKEWKEALQEVGQMKGWHVTESDSQGAIVEEVLSEVESHLRSMYTIVTDELVGIDTHVEKVMELLNLGSSNKKIIVGIHGMGGIGKTTLSQAVYNKICVQFDRCCFLEDVRETLTKSDGAVCLQNKVISSILKKDDSHVKSVSEGINMIKKRVCKHKVLVVIDDIDENFKFDKILGQLVDFSSDSKFILTTRYKRAFDFLPNCRLYELGEMSCQFSLQLFSKHALGMDNPPEKDAAISKEFVKVAAGLPLALKVIGSLLFRRGRKIWEEKLIELQGIPSTTENKVQASLKISYKELTHNEKQIFLDIACFFIGSHKDLPYYMWSGCDFYPEGEIDTLIHRSLIKLDQENRFWMHDHIRDLGRAIVKEEDVQHPYNRSRIWSTEDALNMLRKGEGSERVEVLRVDLKSGNVHGKLFKSKEFKNLSGLRYLEVRFGSMMGDFSQVLPNICCLRLHGCGLIPIYVNTKKLAVLDLDGCNVKDDWKGWSGVKAATKLKAINLPDCSKLKRAPDLSTCASLELINFERCGKMEGGLHIGNFKKLKKLKLGGTKIRELIIRGNDIGKLQRLEEMDLRFSYVAALPAGMENLSSLKILLLEAYRYPMKKIPRLPRCLKRLTISTPSGVPNLLELKELESLTYLNAWNPWIPGVLWRLPNLKELTVTHCYFYGALLKQEATSPAVAAALPPSLTSLRVRDGRRSLNELPSLANLRNLTHLSLSQIAVAEIRGLGELRALETLWICHLPNLNNLDGLENLLLLVSLSVCDCAALERLPSIVNLIKLKRFLVSWCPVLVEIQGLGESLSRLEIKACPSLTNLDGLGLLGGLEDFHFEERWSGHSGITLLKKFPDVSGFVNLKRLKMERCPKMMDVRGLVRLVSLESLDMQYCTSIRRLPDLSGLRNLNTLDLRYCESLINLSGIGRLESLQQLRVTSCRSITKLPNLSGLKNLEEMELSDCTKLSEVKGLEGLESLRKLLIFGCRSITQMPNLSGLKNLEELYISGCVALTEFKGIEGLESLTTLRIVYCRLIKDLGNVSGLKNLKELNIEGCKKLTKVNGLEELEGLLIRGMRKRMRVKYLAKSAARYGMGITFRFLGISGAGVSTPT